LVAFNEERLDINRKGMLVLGSWAALNLVSSPIMASRSQGAERYFYQMNGYWNAVNLVIAGFGYYGAISGASDLGLAASLTEQHNIEKILLLNTGLDLAYMAGGMYLIERSRNTSKNPDRLRGFGRSIVLQGAFLFTFDVILYAIHHRHGKALFQIVEGISFHPGISGGSLTYTF
jgi:hypothetical protein